MFMFVVMLLHLFTEIALYDTHTDEPTSLCRGETLVTRLFFHEFFGDLGKKYLQTILVPLITAVLKKEKEGSLEVWIIVCVSAQQQ